MDASIDVSYSLLRPSPGQNSSREERWWQHLSCCYLPLMLCRSDPEKKRKALVQKNGSYRVSSLGLGPHRGKFLADMYITLIDLEWRFVLLALFSSFLATFLLFGLFWWLMAYLNGDFSHRDDPDHELCLEGVSTFWGILLFSMETQTTIGYGFAFPNPHCLATVPLLYLQVVVGLFLETFLLGAIFVKIGRPKYRANTIMFSHYAVINQQDGQLVLQVRVGDVRKTHLVATSITGMVVRDQLSGDGSYLPLYQYDCPFTAQGMHDRVCLLWPVILTHVIDQHSPLYRMSQADFSSRKFELVLYLSGTVDSTGNMCQARTSYLSTEIFWGYRFGEIEEFDEEQQRWRVNFSAFHNLTPDPTLKADVGGKDLRQSVIVPPLLTSLEREPGHPDVTSLEPDVDPPDVTSLEPLSLPTRRRSSTFEMHNPLGCSDKTEHEESNL